ncbi:tetratricopeptide repeat protein 16-like isoform X2 [Ruditapes philippinarum]|uniref:tetratricopeptide repeat protein 16-like isoform X2 n=1 Tax=Ruditapes philippinarum TaxID=129788 RepID=UPI00295C1C57|nr:tetratricopeptide repeat protein 16-like isoform X2 [Ruditapes philippinarum]
MSEQEIDTPTSGRGLDLGQSPATPISIDTPTLMKREGNESFRPESSGELEVDDHVFDVQLSEITEDPNQVNVHQFYPELEHQFMKDHHTQDNGQKDEKSGKDTIEEPDSRSSHMALVPSTVSGTPWSKEDEYNSSDPQFLYYMERWRLSVEQESRQSRKTQVTSVSGGEGVFSTAVDEKTLEEAKLRQNQSIFHTEKWGMEKPPQPSMQEIMDETAVKHFNKAIQMKEEGNYQGVILFINKAMGIRKDDVRFFVERAEAYLRLCDFQSAILNYKKACLLDPSNEQFYNRLSFLYYFQGQSLFDQRLYPEALEAFSRAAEMRPDNIGYHIRSITCLAALQRHGECLALVNKRLETDKDNADLYVMRARLHEMFRNTTLCYYDVKDALGIEETHPEAGRMMGKLQKIAQENKRQAMQLNLMGKHREALQKISIAIETDPAIADFHVLRGALHRKLGDYNAAIDDFLLALDKCDHNEESPVYIDSQRQLLLTYNDFSVECFTKGFFDEAIILLNKAIKGEKREKGLYINRGDCFFRQEEYNFAMQDYEQALELDPTNETIKSRISVIHNEFGVAAYQEKRFSEAESKFNQAIEFHPKVGQYYISRARARYMLENMTGARGDLLMGLLLDPNNEDVISILSRLFPGKSVGDVLASRAAESAKIAIRNIFDPPRQVKSEDEDEEGSEVSEEGGEADGRKSETESQSAGSTGATSEDSEPMWRPGTISDFKVMMNEQEFNIKLVEMKQDVNTKIKSALFDRKTLKYDGPRMLPLPPPKPKPQYGGKGVRREKLITPPGKKKSTNWRTFSSGIGLGGN